ncbi:hypothetical protein [Conexibacter arvalis]|uniref:hypothetical protein n=1 Tax=Conexibacter arvalis TaxID=912552 RepID=UPI001C844079|nr:hypothetical protein [Conexibacter arvalis]
MQPGRQSASLSTTQAGAHPDVVVTLDLNRDARNVALLGTKQTGAALPPGLVGNPTIAATCSFDAINRIISGRADTDPCPREAAVGSIKLDVAYPGVRVALPQWTRRLYRLPTQADEPAAFGTTVLGYPVKMVAEGRSDGDYGLTVIAPRLPESVYLNRFEATFWGVPADHQGPGDLWDGILSSRGAKDYMYFGGPLAGAPRKAFMSNPSSCTGNPLSFDLMVQPWVRSQLYSETVQTPAVTGCDAVPFEPSIEVRPASSVAGAPSGYEVDIVVPQSDDADTLSTAHLKDATVVLPEGTAISPPVADGLQTCTDAQLGLDSRDREACPFASKIGTVTLDTPLLEEPLTGGIYQGTQQSSDPASGEMYRLFLTAAGSGVRIKLRGNISVNPATGQLTTTFVDNPQLPFSRLSLTFKGGDRAPLVNPHSCGEKTATAKLTAWSGAVRDVSSSFAIDQGCPTGLFAPSFTAGTLDPAAGAYSPFAISIGRADGEQDLDRLTFAFPLGVVGMISNVPLCGEAAANAGTCGEESRIGSLTVATGTGGAPLQLPGRLYLTDAYGGGAFGISIVVPAIAGPFDLGTVVVRGAIHVDRATAQITIASDPLPAIVGGVPLHMRAIDVRVDRPQFMFNATSCQRQVVGTNLTGTGGGTATPSHPYQAKGYDRLPYTARLKLTVGARGKTKLNRTTPLTALLTQPVGQTNSKSISVLLPRSINARLEALRNPCELEDYRAERCGRTGLIGDASAITPVLREPLRGNVYLVRNPARRLPDIMVALRGQVAIDVTGIVRVAAGTFQLGTRFNTIPDVPLTRFRMTFRAGRGALLGTAQNLCAKQSRTAAARIGFRSQARGLTRVFQRLSTRGCGAQAAKATANASAKAKAKAKAQARASARAIAGGR